MVKTFQIFFFRTFLKTTLGVSVILTSLIWLVQSLRFLSHLSVQKSDMKALFALILNLFPRSLVIGLCFGFFCALMMTFYKSKQEKECQAIMSFGATPSFFAWPSAILGLFLGLAIAGIMHGIGPWVYKKTARQNALSRGVLDPALIMPGIFFHTHGLHLYVHRKKSFDSFEGIFLADERQKNHTHILSASHARMINRLGYLEIHCRQGTYQSLPQKGMPYFGTFEDYIYRIPVNKEIKSSLPVQGLPWKDLKKKQDVRAFGREYQQRIWIPFLPLIIALWSFLFLFLGYMPTQSSFIFTGISGIAFYIIVFSRSHLGLLFSASLALGIGIWAVRIFIFSRWSSLS